MIVVVSSIIRHQPSANSKQTASKQQIPSKTNTKKTPRMSEINYSLLSEIIFTNDNIFDSIDLKTANNINYICKAASENKNIKLSYDRAKAFKYFESITDIVSHHLMYKNKEAYMKREELQKVFGEEYSITSQLDDVVNDLKKENRMVLEGFRELIVLEFREFIYNYENCGSDSYDIKYNLDYCIQYNLVVIHFGYYEYYENHKYDPKHFVITPDSLYDFVKA